MSQCLDSWRCIFHDEALAPATLDFRGTQEPPKAQALLGYRLEPGRPSGSTIVFGDCSAQRRQG